MRESGGDLGRYSQQQIDLLKRTIAKGVTNDELALFVLAAQRLGLDPFAKQVYAVTRYDSRERRRVMTIQTSIDGFRVVAERNSKYAGQLGPWWWDGTTWLDVWTAKDPPLAARIGILRHDFKEPLYAVARFESYVQRNADGGPSNLWRTMPEVMIAKCAEALALRRAFPNDLSGVYTSEEMGQAANELAAPSIDAASPEASGAPEATPELSDEQLTHVQTVGMDADPARKAAFYDEWLPAHGYLGDDRNGRWRAFVRGGASDVELAVAYLTGADPATPERADGSAAAEDSASS